MPLVIDRLTKHSEYCSVCGKGSLEPGFIYVCEKCIHPRLIRTFCRSCGIRFDYTLEQVHAKFEGAKEELDRTGVVYRFEKCMVCAMGGKMGGRRFDYPPPVIIPFPSRQPSSG